LASRTVYCPIWCVTKHGEFDGEEDHLHTGAGLRLAHGITAPCAPPATPTPEQPTAPKSSSSQKSGRWNKSTASLTLIALTE
jgi:hypothetical protein